MQLSVKNKGRRLGAKRNCLDAGDVVRGSAIFFLAKVLTSLTFVSAFHLPGKCRGGYQPGGINVGVFKGRFRMGWKVPLAPPQAGWSTQNAPPRSGREHSPNRRSNYMLQILFISRKNASKRTKNLRKTPESSSNQLKMCSPSLLKSPPQMTESPSRTGVEHCGGLLPLVPFRMGWVSTPF